MHSFTQNTSEIFRGGGTAPSQTLAPYLLIYLYYYFRFFLRHLHDVERPVMSCAICAVKNLLTRSLDLTYVGRNLY